MNLSEFKNSTQLSSPPTQISHLLKALWYDAKGDWETAHNLAQDINTKEGSWVHAYLHRKEGDLGNASYWYHRASQPVAKNSLAEEWDDIVSAMLN